MRYAYYPGCSLEHSAVEYNDSTRVLMETLGVELHTIPDWTCCGASAVNSVDELFSYVIAARNVALAEKFLPGLDILAPCSACYLNLLNVVEKTRSNPSLMEEINSVLAKQDLNLSGAARVRHIVDVLANDVLDALAERTVMDMKEIRFAPYYGCQILRPYPVFDDPEHPTSMEGVIRAMGAEIHAWSMGGKCCGASLMATHRTAAIRSVAKILRAAQGADAIITVCPMCEMNLEAYQSQALRTAGLTDPMSVLYLPQAVGLALGLSQEKVGLPQNLTISPAFLAKLENRSNLAVEA